MTLDTLGRPLRSLRVSVTDRCNLRCQYCMPEDEYVWLRRDDLLSFAETERVVGAFVRAGVSHVRLTGGEPLLRPGLPSLVRSLAALPGVEELSLTTNGVLLADQAGELFGAGLARVTVSLDTLRPERFRAMTRRDELGRVLEGVASVRGRPGLKLDTVVVRGFNDDELADLVEYAQGAAAEVRFIEYMDVGGATRWSPERVVSRAEIVDALGRRYGRVEALPHDTSAPAERFRLPDGSTFGIVASTTTPFCRRCDRSRLTADGVWFLCLYALRGHDLRSPARAGATEGELAALVERVWRERGDRGAEERLALRHRSTLVRREALRGDPHLEMHTRGG
jgi:cyclic pyranopterin phosphate synthase